MLADIPQPRLLDPDRVPTDDREEMTSEQHRARWKQIAGELTATCEYAQDLWKDLAATRQYLHDSLPPENPQVGDPTGAAPTGPDDDEGWRRWQDAYTSVTSLLCGPRGDNHFGEQEAVVLAQNRRVRPEPADSPGRHAAEQGSEPIEARSPSDTSTGAKLAGGMPDPDAGGSPGTAAERPTDASTGGAGIVRLVSQPLAFVAVGALAAVAAMRGRQGS